MNSKAGAFGELAKNRKQDRLASDKVSVLAVALLGLVAAIAIVYLATPLANLKNPPTSPVGIDAHTARWVALGAQYAPDLEASVEASSARWTALSKSFSHAQTGLGRGDPGRSRSSISKAAQGTEATGAYAPYGPFDS